MSDTGPAELPRNVSQVAEQFSFDWPAGALSGEMFRSLATRDSRLGERWSEQSPPTSPETSLL